MNHNGLLQWIYAHILDEQMNSDPRQLALELRMTEKTIDSALHKEGSAEYTLLFEQTIYGIATQTENNCTLQASIRE